jgi:dTMP kinase
MSRGKYIVIEGPQGVGKSTQILVLAEKLKAAGLPTRIFREPDSQSDLTARTIRQMTQDPRYPMNTRTEVLLYNAARSQSLDVIKNSVANGVYCICDRNYLTTLAIQYYGRGDIPDYDLINQIINFAVGSTNPDLTIIMDAPVNILRDRVQVRDGADRFDNLDEGFLERVRAGYLWEANQRHFPVVFSTKSLQETSREIWDLVTPVLANRGLSTALSAEPASIKEIIEEKITNLQPKEEQTSENLQPLIEKVNDINVMTEAGKDFLSDIVTTTSDNVYAFTDKISPVTISAAMARLSRRGDDMRITILDEFAGNLGKDEKLLQRVITAYGDDSVQQLTGQHLVVEGASNLLTKKLEWGRLAAYLEQSTRYIYFDQKDENDHYKYFIPRNLNSKIMKIYTQKLNNIFKFYSEMVNDLTAYIQSNSSTPKDERDGAWRSATRAQSCDAVRPVLPVATKSTVGIYGSSQAIESLIMHLQSEELIEAKDTGDKILDNVRKVAPVFYERADKPDRGGAMIAYRINTAKNLKQLTNKYLPGNYGDISESVTLSNYYPRNELELIPDMLYENSSFPLKEIQKLVETWPLKKKTEVFKAYMGERLNRRHKPGRAIEKAHYSWDLVCDYGIFRDLQRHRMVDNLVWQDLSPRYGYDIPSLIEEANLTDKFQACFTESVELYSVLQEAGYSLEAQYATLLGHKMRWQVTYNAREAFHLHELRTSPQGHPGYRKLVQEMHEKLLEVHPLLGEAMRFVNQGEDPELTRLAAERYTQLKLSKLV